MTPCFDVKIICNCIQWCPRKLKINCGGCVGSDDITPDVKTHEVAKTVFELENIKEQHPSKKTNCIIL